MTDISRLLASLKRRSAHAKEFGHDVLFVKLEDIDALVEELEKAQRYITELDREHQTFRIVGVRSVKASLRVENSKSRFIELWLRPGIFLPHKRPEHSMSYYAGMAVLTGTKAEIYLWLYFVSV
ncbi:hypothetical protein ACEW7P_21280 [Klebsiella variicola]|uniref:hypothetical protein n=2 Tax=Klebsiella/Raoultella group TaxID=2890311 RepID=UPI000D74FA78|nr:hypothetical protein [Klebsiella variicola]PXJ92907.1 hypothetical protein DMR35_25500 [Klebsiella variicola]HBQ8787110.1 hypothetical protein [Klebsiella quasipneumoniae]HDS6109955.1 hypothetical protein [Klebsiella pneumoniae]HDS6123572.1 hypothetical protein [Klebsiella pneumoniae subsp. pneumoniae]